MEFLKLQKELLKRAENNPTFFEFRDAINCDQLMQTIRDNFVDLCINNVVDASLIEEYKDLFTVNKIYGDSCGSNACNPIRGGHFLRTTGDAHAKGDTIVCLLGQVNIYTRDNVYVYARRGDSHIIASNNVTVDIEGGHVDAFDNANIQARGDTFILAFDRVEIDACGDVKIKACGDVIIDARGNVKIKARGNVKILAFGSVEIEATDAVDVTALENVVINAKGDAKLNVCDDVRVTARGKVEVFADGHSFIIAYDEVIVDAQVYSYTEAHGEVTIVSTVKVACHLSDNAIWRIKGDHKIYASSDIKLEVHDNCAKEAYDRERAEKQAAFLEQEALRNLNRRPRRNRA